MNRFEKMTGLGYVIILALSSFYKAKHRKVILEIFFQYLSI